MDAPTVPGSSAQDPAALIPSDDDAGPGDRGVLHGAMEMGEAIGAFLAPLVDSRLAPRERSRLRGGLRLTTAAGAYAGLGLWTVAALTPGAQRARDVGEAIAGACLGLLKANGAEPGGCDVAGGLN